MIKRYLLSYHSLIFSLTLIVFNVHFSYSQHSRQLVSHNKHEAEIPFKYYNGLIEVKVKLNGIPMNFIFDTGAEHTILSNNSLLPLLKTQVTKEIEIYGADFSQRIKAYITIPVKIELFKTRSKSKQVSPSIQENKNNRFEFSKPDNELKSLVVRYSPMLILDRDIFNFDKINNSIQGILGASFFSNSILKIDYKRKVLIVYPYNYKLSKKGYKEIPVEFKGHKPIIKTKIKINNQDTSINANILMDTGSSIPLLFLENLDSKFKLPDKTIYGQLGVGLGGDLMGYIGLIDNIELGEFKFQSQISKFQNLDSLSSRTINKTRDGLIGNEVLKKFTIIIDNFRKKLYFKPNNSYYKPVTYDKSGLTLYASGKKHNKYFIKYIIPDSPADLAGLKPRDQIYSAQNFNYIFWTIDGIIKLFKKNENKKIRLKIIRDGEKQVITFRLKDMFK